MTVERGRALPHKIIKRLIKQNERKTIISLATSMGISTFTLPSIRICLCNKINIQYDIDHQQCLRSNHVKSCRLFRVIVFHQLQGVSRRRDDRKNKE